MAAVKSGSLLAAVAVVMVAAAKLVGHADAATYVVGDFSGWKIPSGTSEYADWASKHVFVVGDVLVFNFTTRSHDVARVTKDSFDACNTSTPLDHFTEGPANVTLNSTGDNYYICTLGGGRHCHSGQKLAISVTGTSPPPTAPPPPRSQGGSSQSPPPSSTAVTTTCTSFVVIISSLIYGLVAL